MKEGNRDLKPSEALLETLGVNVLHNILMTMSKNWVLKRKLASHDMEFFETILDNHEEFKALMPGQVSMINMKEKQSEQTPFFFACGNMPLYVVK